AYKAGTHVAEASQGVAIANLLLENGYEVSVYDPMAMEEAKTRCHQGIRMAGSVQACVEESDVIFVMTAWPEFAQEITPSFLRKLEGRKVFIDCWRCLPRSTLGDICELVYLGCGNHLSCHAQQSMVTA
ncbi:MAG: NAD(P)-binding domain-containing protein, partial [Verrucomicrobia bacterium]|nr:NAD(P)-binding domain-containing protein [Verrucomicrobiota bacterium]